MKRDRFSRYREKKNQVVQETKETPPPVTTKIENQALDGFSIKKEAPDHYIQKISSLNLPPVQRRYDSSEIKSQIKMSYFSKPKLIAKIETLEKIIIKGKEKPRLYIKKQQNFNVIQKAPKKFLRKIRAHNFLIEKSLQVIALFDKLTDFLLPSSGKFFHNKPELKIRNIYEVEYLKIKAPYKFEKITDYAIPRKEKKTSFVPEEIQTANSELTYIINKTKKFNVIDTVEKKESSLSIDRQPKKVKFTELISEQKEKVMYEIPPVIKMFYCLSKENKENIFLPSKPKRYLTNTEVESVNLLGTGQGGEVGLEMEFNADVFIPNVYDMLLIQNIWDQLETKSFSFNLIAKTSGGAGMNTKENRPDHKEDANIVDLRKKSLKNKGDFKLTFDENDNQKANNVENTGNDPKELRRKKGILNHTLKNANKHEN